MVILQTTEKQSGNCFSVVISDKLHYLNYLSESYHFCFPDNHHQIIFSYRKKLP